MKIFLDTANYASVEHWAKTGIIDGVTTNPTHLAKEGKNPIEQILAIAALLPKAEVSVEVTETEPEAIYKQAKAIAALAPNIIVKIPCHVSYYPVIKRLVDNGIKLNITLLFTLMQGVCMGKLGAYCISPFVGRLDDIDASGTMLLADLRYMLDQYEYSTQLLAASLRTVGQLHEAIIAGADIVTVPINVLEKALSHPQTDRGMEKFLADWQKLDVKKFP